MSPMVLKVPCSERSALRSLAFAGPAVAALALLAFISLLVGVSDFRPTFGRFAISSFKVLA